MNSTTSRAYSTQMLSYELLEDLQARIVIEGNPYCIPPESLFAMAARNNNKRGFLFVSKLLGKHIPVHPLIPLIGSGALAGRYAETVYGDDRYKRNCNFVKAFEQKAARRRCWHFMQKNPLLLLQPTIFIGFAETATALGHGVFGCFNGPGKYIHTTHECIPAIADVLDFTEEHSHVPEHHCYCVDAGFFNNQDAVVLIDDEITTGKSALNFIQAIQRHYPRREYALLSILDWRSPADRQRFAELEAELGITIRVISLLSGQLEVKGSPVARAGQASTVKPQTIFMPQTESGFLDGQLGLLQRYSSLSQDGQENDTPYLAAAGRFGVSTAEQALLITRCRRVGQLLQGKRHGKRTLCLGTGEFMYLPVLIASYMGEGVTVSSTTRSPIYPDMREGYGINYAAAFPCPSDNAIANFAYNIKPGAYDEIFIFLEREVSPARLEPILKTLGQAVPRVVVVVGVSNQTGALLPKPQPIGSYAAEDVVFLLKDLAGLIHETATEDREEFIQGGTHYSEMLPLEYQPEPEYLALFHKTLQASAKKVALAAGVVAEKILQCKGPSVVLVSLARAGTPIGILIKRYLKEKYALDLPHYSISIIRGKGIDENALRYILRQHPGVTLQFVDGWTGKGAITKQLIAACAAFNARYGTKLTPDLAVLADPGSCVSLYGTREDYLIPSACLNATVSGLVSRTVHRDDLIGENDFHGCKFYHEWKQQDVSQLLINTVTKQFPTIAGQAESDAKQQLESSSEPNWGGLEQIKVIQSQFGLQDINLVKPGVGETTRVLLRRVPWRILVDSMDNPHLQHILLLAKDRNVQVEEHPNLTYSCCGLIKPMGGS